MGKKTVPKVVVVGAGLSGLMVTLRLAEKGVPVALVSLLPAARSDSSTLHSGFAASLGGPIPKDSPEKHFRDTIVAGEFLANQESVRNCCLTAPSLFSFLDRIGVVFDRSADGYLESFERTYRVRGGTAKRILSTLDGQIRRYEDQGLVMRKEGYEFLSLILDDAGSCRGVTLMDVRSMKCEGVRADAVVMATGGIGSLFVRSTGGSLNTGQAVSMVYQQGAPLANPEMIHFQPAVPISETKAVAVEVSPGSSLLNLIRKFTGIDPPGSPLPATSVPSYWLGGLWTDENQMTGLHGVFAVGESQFQFHGAGLISSNIIPAALFSALTAAESVFGYLSELKKLTREVSSALLDSHVAREEDLNGKIRDSSGKENPRLLSREHKQWMSEHVSTVRRNEDLKDTDEKILELMQRYRKISLSDLGSYMNEELRFARDLRHMLELSRAIVGAALRRKESRGCHVRADFPKRDDDMFLKTSKVYWTTEGPRVEYEDVDLRHLKP